MRVMRMHHCSVSQSPRVTLEDKVAFLSRPDSYPEATARVQVIETHMSWVFLTERFVYKFKKARRYDHLDFAALPTRRRNCVNEVRLNRRLAPDVYLGVVALRGADVAALHLGGAGPVVEWLVHMRRLPADGMLDEAIRARRVTVVDVRRFAALLAGFYAAAKPVRMNLDRYRARYAATLAELDRELCAVHSLPPRQVHFLTAQLGERLEQLTPVFAERLRARCVVEAHGDLRPEHVYLGPQPAFIDCLEFDRNLRFLDSADELAFLALECERLGAAWIGDEVFATYGRITGDRPPPRILAFYKAYRALVRAQLALWHVLDPAVRDSAPWHARAREYLDLSAKHAGMAG